MNEDLVIKLKVDTSAVSNTINKLKNDVSNVNKTINSTGSVSKTTQSTSQQAQQAASKLSQSIKAMVDGINKLKNVGSFTDVAEIASEFIAANVQTKAVKNSLEQVEETTERITKDTQKWVNELREALLLSKAQGNTEYTYASGGREGKPILKLNIDDTLKSLTRYTTPATKGTDKLSASLAKVNTTATQAQASVKGLGAAGAATTATVSKFTAACAAAGTAVAGLAAAVLGIAAVIEVLGIIAAFKVSPLANDIYLSAQKVGMSTESYQRWGFIMERMGSTIDDLIGYQQTLASEQAAVIEGSEDAAAAFHRLGMSTEEVAGMRQQELFETTIARLQGIEDVTQRSAIAYSLFGDEASNLMNVLNLSNADMQRLTSNYELLGGVMSVSLLEKSNALQNSLANLKQAWQGVSNTLAEVFIPMVKAVVNWLTKLVVIINLALRTLFGLDLKPALSKGMDKAASSTKNYTNSVGAATKAVEKLKRTTMGFDELNIAYDSSKDAASGGGGAGAGLDYGAIGGALDTSVLNTEDLGLEKIYSWFEEYKTLIQDITTWSLIAIGVIGAVLCGLGGNWVGMIACLGMAGLGFAVGSVEGGTFDRLKKKLETWWGDVETWFNEKVKPVFTKQYWVEKWDNLRVAAAEKLDELGNKIFKDKWEGIKTWFREKVKPIFTKQYWVTLFDNIKQGVSDSVENTKKTISDKWKNVQDWFAINVKPKFTKQYWITTFENIRTAAGEKLEATKKTISDKWKSVQNWFTATIKPKFTATYWKEKFSSIKDGAKESFNGVIGVVESAVNKIVKKINTLSWDVPDWVPAIGGSKWGFNFKEISIPRLATGGIATGSTLANVGEAGAEAILPLENNTSWMDALADKIAARNQTPSKLVLKVGERELGWVAIDSINSITKEMGGLQLAL